MILAKEKSAAVSDIFFEMINKNLELDKSSCHTKAFHEKSL